MITKKNVFTVLLVLFSAVFYLIPVVAVDNTAGGWVPDPAIIQQKFKDIRYADSMQAEGNARALLFLVEFPDKPRESSITRESLQKKIFGPTEESVLKYEFPFETITGYIERASFGTLNYTGEVIDWYMAQHNRDFYHNNPQELVLEVLSYFDNQIDYSQFDGNDDGLVDSINILYSGGVTYFSDFWWAWATKVQFPLTEPGMYDSMNFRNLIYMPAGWGNSVTQFNQVLIHETFHLLGLRDYYGANSLFNTNGGTLADEIMDNNAGDLSAYSKMVLGWIKDPIIIGSDTQNIRLSQYTESGQAALIFPYENNYNEFFIVENRDFKNNNYLYEYRDKTESEFKVFRVNLSDSGLRNRLGEVKVLESIIYDTSRFDAYDESDYFLEQLRHGGSITPYTIPSTYLPIKDSETGMIVGKYSGLFLENVRLDGTDYVFDVRIEPEPNPEDFTLQDLQFGDRFISVTANSEFFAITSDPVFYLTDGINRYYYKAFNARNGLEQYKHKLMFEAVNPTALPNQSNNLPLRFVIPQGSIKTYSGIVPNDLSLSVSTFQFPNFANSYTRDLLKESAVHSSDKTFFTLNKNVYSIFPVYSKNPIDGIASVTALKLNRFNVDGSVETKIIENFDVGDQILLQDVFVQNDKIITSLVSSPKGITKFIAFDEQGAKLGNQTIPFGTEYMYRVLSFGDKIVYLGRTYESSRIITFGAEPIPLSQEVYQGFIQREMGELSEISNVFQLTDLRYVQLIKFDYQNNKNQLVLRDHNLNVVASIPTTFEFVTQVFQHDENRIIAIGYRKIGFSHHLCFDVFDNELNLLMTKSIYTFEQDFGRVINFHSVQTEFGFIIDTILTPTPTLTAYSPYTRTLFLDRNLNIFASVTDRASGKARDTITLPLGNRIFSSGYTDGNYIGTIFTHNYSISDPTNFSLPDPDVTAPIITINPNTFEPTNQPVTVYASTNEGILNQSSYTFDENGEFTFVATDLAGNSTSKTVTITTIDKTAPVITGVSNGNYYNTNKTITFNEGSGLIDGSLFVSGSTVSTEGTHTLTVTDSAGNSTTVSFTIDKIAPVITIDPYIVTPTNQDITVTASTDEGTLNATSHTFTENGSFTFRVTDAAGNLSEVTVTITTIDKTSPVITGLAGEVYINSTPVITFNEGSATLNGIPFTSGNSVTQTGEYTLRVTDLAGNVTEKKFRVIDGVGNISGLVVKMTDFNAITLIWNASNHATGYEIYRATSATGIYTKTATVNEAEYVSSGLSFNTTYFYKVRAYMTYEGGTVYSAYSSVVSGKTVLAPVINAITQAGGFDRINVQWNAVTGASGYEVWRSTGTSTTYVLVKTQTTVGFLNTTLVTNTTYNYKIRAYRLVGTTKVYGAFSTVTSARPIPSAPSITVISSGTNSLKVSWPAVSGATAYELSYSLIENGTYALLPLQTSTTASISGLIVDTTYFFKVRAYRLVGTLKVYSGYSTIASAKPIPSTPVLSGTSGGFDRVNLSWTAIAGASGYELYRLDGDSYTLISDQLTLSYTDDELVTGATRSYKVVAYAVLNDVKVRSLDSTIINVTPIPALSESFNVSLVDYNLMALDWSDVLGASGYEVSYASTATGAASVIADLNVSEYTRSGLTFNSTGYYRVRAYTTVNNAKVYGNWTTALAVKTALTSVSSPSAAYTAYNAIQVQWSAVNGASGYEVWRSTGTSTYYTLIKTQTTVGFLNTSLATNTRYNYKIRAYRLVGTTKVYGAYSSVVSSIPLPWAPSPTATSAAYNALTIRWPAVSGANGYEVSYATSEASPFTVRPTLTTTSTTITGLLTNTPYTIRVRAYRIVNYKKVFGAYSSLVTGTPIPSTPTLKVVSGGFDSLNLSWAAIPGATGYEVQWLNPETSTYELLNDTTTLSTVHSGLVSGVVQSYRISAYRLVGDTKVYSTASPVITGTPVPSTALGLKLSATNVSTLDFTWTPVLGASGYEVSRSTTATGVYTTLGSTKLTTYQLSGLAFNATSYVKVRAYTLVNDVKVYGAWTTAVVGKTLPGTPVLTLSSPSYTSVQVNWAAVNGVSGYEIWRSTGTSTTYTLIKTQTTAGFLNTGLVFNTRYNYKVRAYKLVGTTKVYGSYSTITSQVTQVSAPSVLSETTPDSIALSWAAVSGASGYEVAIASTKDGPYTVSLQTTLTKTFSALTPGSTVFIKVRAYRLVSTTKVYGPAFETSITLENPSNQLVSDLVSKFVLAGLSVNQPYEMSASDYGMAPQEADEAIIFEVQQGMNSRVFYFSDLNALNRLKAYYDDLGASSIFFYSHTYSKGNYLIQMNGDIPKETFQLYVAIMDGFIQLPN